MRSLSFRPDPDAQAALAYLEQAGMSRSEALRRGVVDLADRLRRASLVREVAALAQDEADCDEKSRILAFMDELAPPPPPA